MKDINEYEKICLKYLLLNYDYLYLKYSHLLNENTKPEVIIAGSSHAMNGIVENEFSRMVINFSISSQDIYYDALNIRRALDKNNNVKLCIINIGYYMLYQDLSLGKKTSSIISRVYQPLFGDSHHMENAYTMDMFQFFKERIDENEKKNITIKAVDIWEKYFYSNPSYYGGLRTRENNSLCENIWFDMSDEERNAISMKRAADHNRLKQHIESMGENINIIYDLVQELVKKNIVPIFVIFPFSKSYLKYINCEYKTEILDVLNSIEETVEFLDMNDYEELFDDNDFVNSDHLSTIGARKASILLDEYIEELYKKYF